MRSAARVLGSCLCVLTTSCSYPPLPTFDAGCESFATLLDSCKLSFDSDLTVMGTVTYDTTDHMFIVAAGAEAPGVTHTTVTLLGDEVDVISARKVQISRSGTLRGIGTRPLAIVASDTLTIEADAQIDVSAGGAGAQTSCANGPAVGDNNDSGAGAGGGGGYGADGGDGGSGNGDGTPTRRAMKGRAVTSVPAELHGGCPGAAGGNGLVSGGIGGAGGGALYVVAANRIQLDSVAPMTAGGGGGHGGTGGNAGGGGGGSGGMLIFEAPHVVGTGAMGINPTITANGGGGGEGADSSPGDDGGVGTLTTIRAVGGSGGASNGADGGHGGSVETPTGETVTTVLDGGGGGGGGGVGFIRILSDDIQGVTMSPAPPPKQ